MLLEEFLVALGVQADTRAADEFADSLGDVARSADRTESSILRAYDATDSFVSAIEGAMGVIGFFTGVLGGAWAMFHGTITELEELIEDNKLLTKVTKDQVDQAKKYSDSIEKLGKRFNSLKVEMAFNFLPTMQRIVNALDDFLEANKDLIANGVDALLDVMTKSFDVIINFVRFIDLIVEKTIGWENALKILGGLFLWFNRAMLIGLATNPVTWIVAAIVGLLLLIDDFMTYLDGGESQFGEFWGAMLKWIDRVKPQLLLVWDLFKTGMGYLKDFGVFVATYFGGALIDAVQVIIDFLMLMYGVFTGNTDLMSEAWSNMVNNLLSMFRNLSSLFVPLANMLTTIMTNVWQAIVTAVQQRIDAILNAIRNFVTSVKDIASNIYDAITAPFVKAYNWISDKFSSIGSLISGAVSGVGRLATVGPTSAVTNSTVNGGNMTVNAPITVTGKDAQKTATLVQNGLSGTLNTAMRNMSSKVIA